MLSGREKNVTSTSLAKPGEVWLSLKDAGSDKGRPGRLAARRSQSLSAGECWGALASASRPLLERVGLKLASEVGGRK